MTGEPAQADKEEPSFSVLLFKTQRGYTWRVSANKIPTMEEALSIVSEADTKLRERYGNGGATPPA